MATTTLCDHVLHRVVAFHGWRGAHDRLARVSRRWRAAVQATVVHPSPGQSVLGVVRGLRERPDPECVVLGDGEVPHEALVHVVLDGVARGGWSGPSALVLWPLPCRHLDLLCRSLPRGGERLVCLEIRMRGEHVHPQPWMPSAEQLGRLVDGLAAHAPHLRRLDLVLPHVQRGPADEVAWPHALWRLARERLVDLSLRCLSTENMTAVWCAVGQAPTAAAAGRLRRLALHGGCSRHRTTAAAALLMLAVEDGLRSRALTHLDLDLDRRGDLSGLAVLPPRRPHPAVAPGERRRQPGAVPPPLRRLRLGLGGTRVPPAGLCILLQAIGDAVEVALDVRAAAPYLRAQESAASLAAQLRRSAPSLSRLELWVDGGTHLGTAAEWQGRLVEALGPRPEVVVVCHGPC